jgi:hypothetical protein
MTRVHASNAKEPSMDRATTAIVRRKGSTR